MKMKPGPRAVLITILTGGLIVLGFWLGRGMPRTWDGVIHPASVSAAAADPAPIPSVSANRVEALESRVDTLEQQVATLRTDLEAARAANTPPPVAPPQDTNPPPTVQQQNSTQSPDTMPNPEIDATLHVH